VAERDAVMDYSKAALVVGLTLIIVIGFNVMLYISATRDNSAGTIEMLRRAAQRARDPWKNEAGDLEELSRMVSTLKNRDLEDQDQT
jgi:hypothetical protein